MATVNDTLIPLLNLKLTGLQSAFAPATAADKAAENLTRKVKALNEGQHAVWREIVATHRGTRSYWFTKKGTINAGTGLKDIDLPADFHGLLFVEGPGAWSQTQFKFRDVDVAEWAQERRRNPSDIAPGDVNEIMCVVSRGNNQFHLRMTHSLPGVNLSILYVFGLTDFASEQTNIDGLPAFTRGPITTYAAETMLRSIRRHDVADHWKQKWMEERVSLREAASELPLPLQEGQPERKYAD